MGSGFCYHLGEWKGRGQLKVVTGEVMARIDQQTIEEVGLPGVVLMERAGQGVARAASELLSRGGKVLILCGPGNNGGDGYVAARLLAEWGYEVDIFGVKKVPKNGDAGINYKILENMGWEIPLIHDESSVKRVFTGEHELIIDALLGTGLQGEVRGIFLEIIEEINERSIPVLSVDIPSGLASSTGEVLGCAVKATKTVTFGLPKVGNVVCPGWLYNGELEVLDIGIPGSVTGEAPGAGETVHDDWARPRLPARPRDAYKGSCGNIIIVGGSPGMTGAPTLAAMAALRSGAGVVTAAVPSSLNNVMEGKLTEAMTLPLPEGEEGYLGVKAHSIIMERARDSHVMVVGPGMGRKKEGDELVSYLVRDYSRPLIIDADGLNALSKPEVLQERPAPTVLTPHPGEMARLLGKTSSEVLSAPWKAARDFAQKYEVIVVLKGPHTLTALPGGMVYVNTSGNEGMATAGSGDVLAGIIGGLIPQISILEEAVVLAVYLHGLAGDLAARQLDILGITAGDMVNMLPAVLRCLKEEDVVGAG